MDTGIKIGNEITVESFEGIAEAVALILRTAGEHRIDEVTTRKALEVIGLSAGAPNYTTVSGCTLYGGTPTPTLTPDLPAGSDPADDDEHEDLDD